MEGACGGDGAGGGRVLRERNLALRWRMYLSSRDAGTDVDWVSPCVLESTRAVQGARKGGGAGRGNGRKKGKKGETGRVPVGKEMAAVAVDPGARAARDPRPTLRQTAVALADIRSASHLVAAFDHAIKQTRRAQKRATTAAGQSVRDGAAGAAAGVARQVAHPPTLASCLHAGSPDMIAAANRFMSHEIKRLRQSATGNPALSYQVCVPASLRLPACPPSSVPTVLSLPSPAVHNARARLSLRRLPPTPNAAGKRLRKRKSTSTCPWMSH